MWKDYERQWLQYNAKIILAEDPTTPTSRKPPLPPDPYGLFFHIYDKLIAQSTEKVVKPPLGSNSIFN